MSAPAGEQVAAWVEAARGGDRAAFGCLVRAFQDAVGAVLLARIGRAESEDLAQDAFVAAFERLHRLREPGRFGPWVCGIARNLARKWVRDGRRSEPLPDDLRSPSGERERDDMAERVLAAVAHLPERLREPVTLFYIDGFTTDDVAAFMELPAGTVRRRLHEARGQLKELLEREDLSVMEEIKRHAPEEGFARGVLDRIAGVRVVASRGADGFLVFVSDENGRSFPIEIGKSEGLALRRALAHEPPASPPTLHELLADALRLAGASVRSVQIVELRGHTFIAQITLALADGETVTLDARPSDVLPLAVRDGGDLRVAREVTRVSCAQFDHPEPVDHLIARIVGPTDDELAELRRRRAAEPADAEAAMRLGEALVTLALRQSIGQDPDEALAARLAAWLAEAVEGSSAVWRLTTDTALARAAAVNWGEAEILRGDFAAAVAAFDRVEGPWNARPWVQAFNYATALEQVGRRRDALARGADALAAIDRQFGTDPLAPRRLHERAEFGAFFSANCPRLTETPEGLALIGEGDPPCVVVFTRHSEVPERVYVLGDRPLTVGSAPEADIQITGACWRPLHGRIERDGQQWWFTPYQGAEVFSFGTPVDGRLPLWNRVPVFPVREVFDASSFIFYNMLDLWVRHRAWNCEGAFLYREPQSGQVAYRWVPLVGGRKRFDIGDGLPWLRTESDPSRPVVDLPVSPQPPRVNQLRSWPASKILARGPVGDERWILLGAGGETLVLPVRHDWWHAILQGVRRSSSERPGTHELATRMLHAVGLSLAGVVLTPFGASTDAAHPIEPVRLSASVCLRGRGEDRWFELDFAAAVALAMIQDQRVGIWVSPSASDPNAPASAPPC